MLRHKPKEFTVEWVDRSREPEKTLPRVRQPVVARFRRDGDMTSVMKAVADNDYVLVKAGVSAGKSTLLPRLIAQHTSKLVVHTIPFERAAETCALYCATKYDDVVFVNDITADLPEHGVVITTNQYLITRLFTDRMGAVPSFIMYMDENHESDCWTAVWRKVALSMSCVDKLILATATVDPGEDLGSDLAGGAVHEDFPFQSADVWHAHDRGKPWSQEGIDGNTLMFIERATARSRLMSEYKELGFDVYELVNASSSKHVASVMGKLRAARTNIVIVLADYSYRSSFTFPNLSRVVDAGEVVVPRLNKDNIPTLYYRRAYHGEQLQARNRGGRIAGERVRTYAPSGPEKKICDVEALEVDGVALIFRMLGYRVPYEYADSCMYTGPVPLDLVAALQGDTPLACYRDEHLVPWVNGSSTKGIPSVKRTYDYKMGVGKMPRAVSCRTVANSPPMLHDLMPDSAALIGRHGRSSSYVEAASRSTSPRSAVYTIESSDQNNGDLFTNAERPAFERPKRVAKHILEQRSREQLRSASASPELPERVDEAALTAVVSNVTDLPDVGAAAALTALGGGSHSFSAPHVMSDMPGWAAPTGKSRRKLERACEERVIPDGDVGYCHYYPNMENAPSVSCMFPRGFDNIVTFCEKDPVTLGARARTLSPNDRLYATKLLLDRYNNSVARVWGIRRLFQELSDRMGELEHLISPDAFKEQFDVVSTQCNDACVEINLCRSLMPQFMDYELVKIGRAETLEQRFMSEYMATFESFVEKKAPDKARLYLEDLDSRQLAVTRGGVRQRAIR